MESVIRVVILDDHALFHQALMSWLHAPDTGIEVAYAGASVESALIAASGTDVVLLDLDLGSSAPPLPQLVASFTDAGCRVLIVSALGSPRVVRQGLAAGALGYMSKREDPADLLAAIRTVATGEGFLSPEMAAILAESPQDVPNLSIQELAALRLYASGLKLDSVARRMNVSPATAKEYLDRVRAKYAASHREVRTKSDMRRAAVEDGFLVVDHGAHPAPLGEPLGVAAALLTVAAAMAVLLVAVDLAQPSEEFSQNHVCIALAHVQDALDLSSLGDQVSVRARAAHLADLLAGGSEAAMRGSARIVAVLDDSRASAADLAEAIEPVAAQCP